MSGEQWTVLVLACALIDLALLGIMAVVWRRVLRPGLDEGDAGLSILDERTDALLAIASTPALPVRRVPSQELVDQAERAGRFADLLVALLTAGERRQYGPGRHRKLGDRDSWMDALLTPTQQFAALVEQETGTALLEVGPREADLTYERLVWAPDEDAWVQQPLPLRGLPPRGAVVVR